MSRLLLFLITLGALAALVMFFLNYDLTAAVATGVVLALAGGATTIVLRLAGSAQPEPKQVKAPPEASDANRARAVEPVTGPAADDQLYE